jgi:hypothetical protein
VAFRDINILGAYMTTTTIYNRNPFLNCLQNYNNCFVKTSFSSKVAEIVKKILLVVAAPFVYLGLGFMALISYPFARWERIIKGNESKKVVNNEPQGNPIEDAFNKKLDLGIKSLEEEITARGITSFEKVHFDLKTQELSQIVTKTITAESGLLYRTMRSTIGEMIKNLPKLENKIEINWKISLIDGPHTHKFNFICLQDKDKKIANKFPNYQYEQDLGAQGINLADFF